MSFYIFHRHNDIIAVQNFVFWKFTFPMALSNPYRKAYTDVFFQFNTVLILHTHTHIIYYSYC